MSDLPEPFLVPTWLTHNLKITKQGPTVWLWVPKDGGTVPLSAMTPEDVEKLIAVLQSALAYPDPEW